MGKGNIQDAIRIIEEKISEQGGTTVGYWSKDGYDFNESKALRDRKFVDLALDEDNQSDLTDTRIKQWVSQCAVNYKYSNPVGFLNKIRSCRYCRVR